MIAAARLIPHASDDEQVQDAQCGGVDAMGEPLDKLDDLYSAAWRMMWDFVFLKDDQEIEAIPEQA